MNVLLVEDNSEFAEIISRALETSSVDYRVSVCETLEHALELMSSSRFDIAVVDLCLPDSEGSSTPKAVIEAAPSMPVVVASGEDFEAFAEELIRMGVQDFLPKGDLTLHRVDQALRLARERKSREVITASLVAYDADTGLYSRSEFLNHLRRAASYASQYEQPFATIAVVLRTAGLNGPGGSWARPFIRQVAVQLRGAVRANDVTACVSEGILATVVRPMAEPDTAVRRAAAILAGVRRAAEAEGERDIRATAGISLCPAHSCNCDDLLAYAVDAAEATTDDTCVDSPTGSEVRVYSPPR